MDYQLVVVRGRSATKAIALPGALATVGRQEGCQLRIVSAQVSRRHCLLYEQDGQLMVKDLGSANGTIVNGKKIDKPQALAAGDILTLGPVKLRVEKLGAPAPAPAGAKAPSPAVAAPGTDDLTVVSEALGLAEPEEDADFEINLDADTGGDADAIPLEEPSAPVPAAQPTTKANEPAPNALSSAEGDDAVAEFLMGLNRQESDEKKR